MQIQFKSKNQKQIDAVSYWIDDTTEEILYGGGKGGGKSYLGASLIFGDALIYPDTHYFIARKELNDLRKFTIPTIHEVFKNWGLKIDDYASFNGQDNIFNLNNGSKVFLIACKEEPSDPLFERFGSMQMTRGWIEEGGEIVENAKANLWLSVGRWKNDEYGLKKKLLITANPKKGWMKRDFIDLWKIGQLPLNRKFVQSLATDNSYLPQDYVQTLANEKDIVRRQRLYEGNWDYEETADSLISDETLTDIFSNTIVKLNDKYMLVDVARMGEDSTVISIWHGLEVVKIDKYAKQSIAMTIQSVKDSSVLNGIPFSNILIDEDGVGGGVVDGLFGVNGFVANSTPIPTATEIRMKLSKINSPLVPKINFANLKAQCAYKLAEYINERKIACGLINYRNEIIEDLSALLRRKDVDGDGKLAIKSKKDIKQEIGRSPDIGDTFIFRMWFELKRNITSESDPKTEQVIIMQRNQMNQNTNNFKNTSNK